MKLVEDLDVAAFALSDVLELLPCPFCGSDDIHHIIDEEDDEYEFIICNGCGAGVSRVDSRPERGPIEVWNMRSKEIANGNDT